MFCALFTLDHCFDVLRTFYSWVLLHFCSIPCYGIAPVLPAFLADTSSRSTHCLIDSGVSKHMCFDNGSFDPNTFVSGTPPGFSGVVMGNGSLATVLGTGLVTITTRFCKKL